MYTTKCKELYKNSAIQKQLDDLVKDIKQLQIDVAKPPPQNIAEAAVYVENFITQRSLSCATMLKIFVSHTHTPEGFASGLEDSIGIDQLLVLHQGALVNAFKLHHTETFQKVGIALFYEIVSFVCDETQRHPPTRQFFTSCIEILGQGFLSYSTNSSPVTSSVPQGLVLDSLLFVIYIFLSCAKTESKTILKKVLQNRRLCNLLSPYFTPNISPDEFVNLYEEVVKVLHTNSGDVIFMLLTK
eukprot:g40331.t1